MIKVADVLYNKKGNKLIVDHLEDDKIIATEIVHFTVTSNDGKRVEEKEGKRYQEYYRKNIGTVIFFEKEDIEKKKIYNDVRYQFNKENITTHYEEKKSKRLNEIISEAPEGEIVEQEDVDCIVAKYYHKLQNLKEEKQLYEETRVDFFGRIDLLTDYYKKGYEDFWRNDYHEKFYVTKASVGFTYKNNQFINWRAPQASLFYENEKLNFNRDKMFRTATPIEAAKLDRSLVYESTVMLKRRFTRNPFDFSDLYIMGDGFYSEGSADPFLMEVLADHRKNHKLSDIIKSIQSNQNKIIRSDPEKNIVVQGCAGSGKTMILLHRLSYLKYNEFLPPENKIKIITPSTYFDKFINDVTHVLDIQHVKKQSLNVYYKEAMYKYLKTLNYTKKNDVNGKTTNELEIKYNKIVNDRLRKIEAVNDETHPPEYEAFCYSDNAMTELKNEYDKFKAYITKDAGVDFSENLMENFGVNINSKNILLKTKVDNSLQFMRHDIKTYLLKLKSEYESVVKLLEDKNAMFKEMHKLHSAVLVLNDLAGSITDLSIRFKNLEKDSFKIFNEIETLKGLKDSARHKDKMLILNKDEMNRMISETKDRINNLRTENKLIAVKSLKGNKLRRLFENLKLTINDKRIEQKEEKIKEYSMEKREKEGKIINGFYSELREIDNNLTINYVTKDYCELTLEKVISEKIETFKLQHGIGKGDHESDELKDVIQEKKVEKIDILVTEILKQSRLLDQIKGIVYSIGSLESKGEVSCDSLKYLAKIEKIQRDTKNLKNISKKFLVSRNDNIEIDEENLVVLMEIIDGLNQDLQRFSGDSKNDCDVVEEEIKTTKIRVEVIENKIISVNEIINTVQYQKKLSKANLLLIDTFEKVLDKFRNRFGVLSNSLISGKHELFLLLFWMHKYFGVNKNPDGFLFIDEGQDLNVRDYELLRNVNGDEMKLNIFGDKNQKINTIGLESWDVLLENFEANYYEINENYRNTAQINDFINQIFGYDFRSIGMEGPEVKHIEKSDIAENVKEEMEKDQNTRIALIYNDKRQFNEYDLGFLKSFHNVTIAESFKVKGVEFDAVFVFDQNMSRNQKYIAYTRALDSLFIVS
ncbi:AAA family ATPase [Isachenkonia alkalipeptolytica]|uniref:DNA helicase n=1 Tax=Isachenkonia alkalipeptolytica TaxID=2565777 RepID=A0AA44BDA4_9CLOT|nr:AAA family ATPase [Isachenkonia alkalipeptolytica]NBG88124.1 hypothetical protein [Isachenkonia alkalipeptolytica]